MSNCICSFPWAGECKSCINEMALRSVSFAATTIKDDTNE